ncbi:hypothetical protein F3Y22_tig00111847pilonHSYRG00299 [Hibiscus syriacus]|uniref:Uncharacterized protein n=1 Tax=Hibiscus syriacus TaxID=106335 RepID=A0A6A2YE61_HIBSY|nr:hypothetical protein F3Y22_tig00111847pilonHSYRG00299 [Hibiscus syriacus]
MNSSHYELSTRNVDPPSSMMIEPRREKVDDVPTPYAMENKLRLNKFFSLTLLPHRMSSSHYELSTENVDPSSGVADSTPYVMNRAKVEQVLLIMNFFSLIG